jgi:hypothetical protein
MVKWKVEKLLLFYFAQCQACVSVLLLRNLIFRISLRKLLISCVAQIDAWLHMRSEFTHSQQKDDIALSTQFCD